MIGFVVVILGTAQLSLALSTGMRCAAAAAPTVEIGGLVRVVRGARGQTGSGNKAQRWGRVLDPALSRSRYIADGRQDIECARRLIGNERHPARAGFFLYSKQARLVEAP